MASHSITTCGDNSQSMFIQVCVLPQSEGITVEGLNGSRCRIIILCLHLYLHVLLMGILNKRAKMSFFFFFLWLSQRSWLSQMNGLVQLGCIQAAREMAWPHLSGKRRRIWGIGSQKAAFRFPSHFPLHVGQIQALIKTHLPAKSTLFVSLVVRRVHLIGNHSEGGFLFALLVLCRSY